MIAIHTLGTAQIDVGDSRVIPTSPRKFALLLYLSVERIRRMPRRTLQELIFPDQTEKNAQHSLRELLYQLRQAGIRVTSDTEGIQLLDDSVSSDLEAFISADRLTIEQLTAVEGGFLPGYAPAYSESFAEWLEGYRARSTFELCKALVADVVRSRRVGDWARTERAARACLGLDPLNEEATFSLAEALAMAGAKVQAVTLLDEYLAELGDRSSDLRLPASILRRRIGERPRAYAGTKRTPFVGREREMEALHDCLSRARFGVSQCVAIVGEAGIGKSRLVAEFCDVIALIDLNIASTVVQPHDVHRPFGAFADLLQKLVGFPGALGVSPGSMRLLNRLVTSQPVDATSFSDAVRDSDSLCHAITHSIIDLVDAIAAECMLVLVIEDIASLDRMSLQLLGYLLQGRRPRRLLLVVTMRDAHAVPDALSDQLISFELRGVDESATASLVATLAARDNVAIDAAMSSWLQEASGGNPLFLESLFAHYASTHERLSIPPDLSNLLRRRVECLPERARGTLQICAVLGRHSRLETISAATQLPRFELTRAVAELETARLIRADGEHIRPAHSLIADVALQGLGGIERGMVHQCAAIALESTLDGNDSGALAWECAEHWLSANNRDRALSAIQRCATHAVEIGRPGDAAQMLVRALSLDISSSERGRIGRQLVTAADEAAEFELVLIGIDALRGESRSAQHDESEFAEFRARSRVYYDARGQEAELLMCVAAEEASPDHRVTAATQLLKYADIAFDRTLANHTIATLSDATLDQASEPTRLEYLMIRHAARRELAQSAAVARRLLATATDLPLAARIKATINAMVALGHSGMHKEAVGAAEQCYGLAGDASAPRFQLIAATFLAEHHFDANNAEFAIHWVQRMEAIVEDYPTLSNQFASGVSRLGMALADGDSVRARSVFRDLDRMGLFDGGPIRTRWRNAALARLNQLEGGDGMSEQQVSGLAAQANQGALIGGICDMEAAVVCHALLEAQKRDAAQNFLATYTGTYRFSRAPLARCLSNVQALLFPQRTDGDGAAAG